MMPCSPPIAFCRTVGQAIFQTAAPIGPSTIDRSSFLRCFGAAGDETSGATSQEGSMDAGATGVTATGVGFDSTDTEDES